MEFSIGDKVRFLDEKGEGKVVEIRPNGHVIVEIDGMDFPFPAAQLVKVLEVEQYGHISVREVVREKEASDKKSVPAKRTSRSKDGVKEFDLHIHNLIDSHRGLNNGQMLQMQLDYCAECMEQAIYDKEERIILIHGIGQGVLKTEVRKLLSFYHGIEFHDASYQRYGYGATEVIIH